MAYKRKTLHQKRKSTRRRNASRSRKIHGGCKDGNCLFQAQQSPLPTSLPNAPFSQNGGQFPPSFSNVPIRSFYPLNMYENDIARQSISSTLIPTVIGGKNQRRRRHQQQSSKRNHNSRRLHSQKGGILFKEPDVLTYGSSLQPSNITDLSFYNTSIRPYA